MFSENINTSSYIQKHQKTILIVDDSMLNRMILLEMLEDEYKIIEAQDGEEAINIIRNKMTDIDLVLLDIMMPKIDGFGVLAELSNLKLLEDIPVIMISAETANAYIKRAYDLGASDFINRPFDPQVVHRRIRNTIMLYSKQKKLIDAVAEQIYEKEENNTIMISILSHIVEFRNGESGLHVLHINALTEILLRRLMQKTLQYGLTPKNMNDIVMASSLHDIGKISIAENILNKPGKLTPNEYDEMKKHSMAGANMMENIPYYKNSDIVKYCYEICRWHHERYDGNGYPDGLAGDRIPISAQVVSLADVYDALVSKRCYKEAYSQEKALEMIKNGECGVFNPILIECLIDAKDEIKEALSADKESPSSTRNQRVAQHVFDDMRRVEFTNAFSNAQYDEEKLKNEYLISLLDGAYFEYDRAGDMLFLDEKGAEAFNVSMNTIHPMKTNMIGDLFGEKSLELINNAIDYATPSNPNVELKVQLADSAKVCQIRCMVIFDNDSNKYSSIIGEIKFC